MSLRQALRQAEAHTRAGLKHTLGSLRTSPAPSAFSACCSLHCSALLSAGQDIDTDVASSTASKTSRSSSASSNVRSTAGKNVAGDIPPGAGSIQGAVLNLVNGGTAKLEGCLLQAPLALHSVIRAGEGSSLVCTSCTLQGGAHGVSNTGSCNVTLVDTLVSDCARGVHMFGDKSTLELTSCTISPSSTVGVYRARGGKRLLKYGGLVIMSGRAKVHSCKIMVDRGGILVSTNA